MEETPKDYEVPTFPELLEQEYNDLSIVGKIIYYMQDHIVLFVASSFVLGYIIGAAFGKFW